MENEEKLTVREQLLTGTLALIADEGPVDLTVRRMAQASNRTTMCVYTKFSNREGLLEAAYAQAAASFVADVKDAESIEGFIDLYRSSVVSNAGIHEFLFEQPMSGLGISASNRSHLMRALTEKIVSLFSKESEEPVDPEESSYLLLATLQGVAAWYRTDPENASPDVWARRFASASRSFARQ